MGPKTPPTELVFGQQTQTFYPAGLIVALLLVRPLHTPERQQEMEDRSCYGQLNTRQPWGQRMSGPTPLSGPTYLMCCTL